MSLIRHGIRLGPALPEVPVDHYIESVLSHPVGAAPLIAALCRVLGIPPLIDQEATWDEERSLLSPGERITALIINLLCEERRPLLRIAYMEPVRHEVASFELSSNGPAVQPAEPTVTCVGSNPGV